MLCVHSERLALQLQKRFFFYLTFHASKQSLHADAETLCTEFWHKDAAGDPVRRFLDDARSLFPAFPGPLLRLLASLASGRQAVTSTLQYLDSIPLLTCKHSSQDAALRQLPGDFVEAMEALPVQNTGLYIPQVPLPEKPACLASRVFWRF